MDFAALAPIVAVLIVGAISPGPSLAILIRNTIEGGKRRGVACGIGHGIGFGIYAFIAITGIAQLKASASGAAELLEIIGGLFLLLLAGLMIRGSNEEVEHQSSGRRGFSEGFLIAFLNPKILAFLIAIFSQFVQSDFTWGERALVASIAMCIDGGWYVLVALIISGTPLMASIEENARKVELAMGILLAGLGVWIVL
ncbi:MAG: LysE family transporter [Candidatus Thalassarchaeaceae archaeon]|jgi:threonine/homoserine/homoserine lactone efflux protein|nr:LysE family transporter [Candidatus Thalassarchaeaceae archaeon]